MEEIAPSLVFVECNLRVLREREMGKERMSSAALLIPLIPHSGSVSLASCLLREASCPAALHNMHYTCVCVYACVCVHQAGKNKKVTRIEREAAMLNVITCRVCLQCFFPLQ